MSGPWLPPELVSLVHHVEPNTSLVLVAEAKKLSDELDRVQTEAAELRRHGGEQP